MSGRESKMQSNALLIHQHIRRVPSTKEDICDRLGITAREFNAAIRYSRTTLDPDLIANEIIGVTSAEPYLYYIAKNVEQADEYISRRAKLADSHLRSVENLLVKELDKYPAKTREIQRNLTTIKRVREDMVYLLAD